jgi:hypothetical protein
VRKLVAEIAAVRTDPVRQVASHPNEDLAVRR